MLLFKHNPGIVRINKKGVCKVLKLAVSIQHMVYKTLWQNETRQLRHNVNPFLFKYRYG